MFKAKYIILNNKTPIVFPETYAHDEMKRLVAPESECTGAGFTYISNDGAYYVCYGESTSLNVKSNGLKDSEILNIFLGGTVKEH